MFDEPNRMWGQIVTTLRFKPQYTFVFGVVLAMLSWVPSGQLGTGTSIGIVAIIACLVAYSLGTRSDPQDNALKWKKELVTSLSCPAFFVGPDRKIEFANKDLCDLYGFPEDRVCGKPLDELIDAAIKLTPTAGGQRREFKRDQELASKELFRASVIHECYTTFDLSDRAVRRDADEEVELHIVSYSLGTLGVLVTYFRR